MNAGVDEVLNETPEARLKRMKMRSWRRGTKEMDMILGPYADEHLAGMDEARLILYDRLLWENDQEILPWILGKAETPIDYKDLVGEIGVFARNRLKR
ncbi:succinate dehydrogenase assembly factor 2 (plasmid) [Pseudorhodobacter turbinis]|uniref:FAD assembly factor SdhE n=1 Tax=Pseudorhodobacter turbinis TaxID=2500533 RepID=A0A4P8ELG4_9RHOB|nr:succinate dehydrogenase assembly factor 2 [Pseudorhodobacter turbinis]QCO57887.1 succinate dehydrogenase assembly factor 2 [Pseudorhodobacter turbinis]